MPNKQYRNIFISKIPRTLPVFDKKPISSISLFKIRIKNKSTMGKPGYLVKILRKKHFTHMGLKSRVKKAKKIMTKCCDCRRSNGSRPRMSQTIWQEEFKNVIKQSNEKSVIVPLE